MHGPDECAFTDLIFTKVEETLGLNKYDIKCGIMDEERRTSANLKECIRALKNRVFSRIIENAYVDIQAGNPIHKALDRESVIPVMFTSMFRIGEETGELSEMITKLADLKKMSNDWKKLARVTCMKRGSSPAYAGSTSAF